MGNTDKINDLPDGWVWTTIGEIVSFEYGKGLRKDRRDENGNIPVYGSNGIVGYHSRALVEEPCLIIGRKGAAGEVEMSRGPCWPIDTTYFVIPPANIDLSYLYYLLSGINLGSLDRSTAIPGLNRNDAYQVSIPMAPFREQQRIVAKIEELFSQLDAGVAELMRVQANLARYKASVLKAACEGRLVPTEAELARAEGRDYESGEELLQRILAERRQKWYEEQRAKGKDPIKIKYKGPEPPDTEDLPELPEGWVWATVEQVCDRIVDCLHSTPNYVESGYYCVDTNWIKPGRLVFKDARYVDERTFIERNRRMVPQEDDVLFSREGALLGVAVRVPENIKICLGQRMMIFRPGKGMQSTYFESILNSPVFKNQYDNKITGTASPHLNIRDIRKLGIPISPTTEQCRIVDEIDQQLSRIQVLEKTITASLRRTGRLRQAILKQAFEGELALRHP